MDKGNDSFSRGSNVDKLEIILFLKIVMVPLNNSYRDFETQLNLKRMIQNGIIKIKYFVEINFPFSFNLMFEINLVYVPLRGKRMACYGIVRTFWINQCCRRNIP